MLSNKQAKLILSLKLKKNRDMHNLFIAEGTKIVPEILDSEIKVKFLFATKEWLALNEENIPNRYQLEIIDVSEKELNKISALSTPNEVLAVAEIPQYTIDASVFSNQLTLVLDEIKDPGNMGTIIRIADWFGINEIICSNNSVDTFNPKVVQATMGSIARIKIHYTDLPVFFNSLKDIPVYGAILHGKNVYKERLADKGIILIGNESKGISENLLPFISTKISIPSFSASNSEGKQGAESLNAAIATAILCSEFRRG